MDFFANNILVSVSERFDIFLLELDLIFISAQFELPASYDVDVNISRRQSFGCYEIFLVSFFARNISNVE